MCLCNNKKVEFPSYSKRKSGNCIGVNIRQIENTITTPGACKIAAKALMVGWTDTSVQEYDTTSYPPGCYLYKYETFFSTTYHLTFNKKLSSTAVYSSTREGVCDVQCGPGTYQNDNSQTECKMCGPGTYQDEIGSGECKTCSAGSVVTSAPVALVKKKYAECGSSDTFLGHFDTLEGCTSACSTRSGCQYFIYGTSHTACYWEKTSSESCSEGWVYKNTYHFYELSDSTNVNCKVCSAGTYQDGQTCTSCSGGKYQPLSGQTSCKSCDAGSIVTAGPGQLMLKRGAECGSTDTLLGHFNTVEECTLACSTRSGCQYFVYGTSHTACYWEKTSSGSCPEGWVYTNNYHFYELSDFSNVNCENINECATKPCQNGGTCTDGVNSYTCTCVENYSGTNCESFDHCSTAPCQNGGTCTDGANAAPTKQNCEQMAISQFGASTTHPGLIEGSWSWVPHGCSVENAAPTVVNAAHWNNAVGVGRKDQGPFQIVTGSYTCTCAAGFFGTNCGTNIDECATKPCQNGGICTDAVASYTCKCADGYAGFTFKLGFIILRVPYIRFIYS